MKNLTILYDQGQADIQWIKDFEKEYSISLPNSYRNLMLKHNGVSFEQNTFNYLGKNMELNISSIEFLPFGIPMTGVASHIINYYQIEKNCRLSENIIPFGLNEFGNYICFDYSQDDVKNNPPIVIMYYDEFIIDEHNNPKMIISPVANSFDDFLEILYEDV